MFKHLRWVVILFALGTTEIYADATLIINGSGILTGARGVNVGGTLYDVDFRDGTCIGLYSGCDQLTDFVFQDVATAVLATDALLDTVFRDVAGGMFDSNPGLTMGCEGATNCIVFTPFGVVPPNGFSTVTAENGGLGVSNGKTIGSVLPNTFDTSSSTVATYAVWSTHAVPEPQTLWLLGTGIGALGFVRRRKWRA